MQSRDLKKDAWKTVLDHMSRAPKTQNADLQITIGNVDTQAKTEAAAFEGMSFDPMMEVLTVSVGGVTHIIRCPLEIKITHSATDILCVEIQAAPDVRYLATFLPPLHLPDLLSSFFPVR